MAVPAAGDRLLTRRRFGLLLSGGAVAAAVAGDGLLHAGRGPLGGRVPARVVTLPPPEPRAPPDLAYSPSILGTSAS